MAKTRLVMIGWDGADGASVDDWLRQGALPNLEALRDGGARGQVESLPGLADDASWGSFATGTAPSTHGRFHHQQIVPGTYRIGNYRRDDMAGSPFWAQIGDAGQRVAILDVPKSPVARHLNGIQMVDWLPHGADGPQPLSWPPELASELSAGFRPREGFNCHQVRSDLSDFIELRTQIHENLGVRTELALNWLARERWDLFLAVFAESHCIGHHYWHLHDPLHPEHDQHAVAVLGDPMRDIHESLDASLGQILSACGPETTVIVFSLLGMGPNYMGGWLADAVLRRLDRGKPATSQTTLRWRGTIRRLMSHVSRAAPSSIRGAVKDVEFARRTAFVVPLDAASTAIRLNLLGREPHGKVHARDYEAHCRFLTSSFLALVDPSSGRRLVADVVNVAQSFPGPRASAFADLLVVWNADMPIVGAASDSIGVVDGRPPLDRSGNHRPGGWFVAKGPGINAGEVCAPVRIVDFARTVGTLLGVELENVEGDPIGALTAQTH